MPHVLYVGHVRYLAAARRLGDVLVVALNSDRSVRRLGKGANRPLVGERDRAEVLAALAAVDDVTIFDEDTPYEVIGVLKPDVHARATHRCSRPHRASRARRR